MFRLVSGKVTYSDDEALETVSRYAFSTEAIAPSQDFPEAFAPHEVPRYGYRTYDCVPASSGPEFTDLDLLVSAGLNADLDVHTLHRLRSFANRAAGHLHLAHRRQPSFLDLTWDELSWDPPKESAGWHLHQAWRQGMATPGLNVARVHKALHHKRPCLAPLLDNKTIAPIRDCARAKEPAGRGWTSWQLIHRELHEHADEFKQLAVSFEELLPVHGGVPLTCLRLYDILVWMKL